jgi:hypothetical protein
MNKSVFIRVHRWLTLFALLAFFAVNSPAGQLVTATLTVTNIPLGAPNTNLSVNGSLRVWTNAQTATSFLTNLVSLAGSKTNLYNQIAANPWTSPNLLLIDNGATSIKLQGSSVVILPQCSNWCSVTYSTNTTTNAYALIIPFDTLNPTNRTNNTAELVYGISLYSTQAIATNSGALSNHMSLGVGPGGTQQQITQRKNFSGGLGVTGLGASNGYTSSLTNINPISSNLVNYGKALRSEGNGANSLQLGSNALSLGLRSTAVGVGSVATNTDSIAVGTSAVATNGGTTIGTGSSSDGGITIGPGIRANSGSIAIQGTATGTNCVNIGGNNGGGDGVAQGNYGIAIGAGAQTYTNYGIAIGYYALASRPDGSRGLSATALGDSTSAGYDKSTALGWSAASTTNNQVRLGTATETVSIPGQLSVEIGATNLTTRGTNTWGGDLAYPSFSVSTLAVGNNISVPFGTNVFIRLAAGSLTASPTICGIIGGATSGGRDGQVFSVFNDTGYSATFAVSTVDPVPANRIEAQGSADVVVLNQGWIYLQWSTANSRWKIVGLYPNSTTATATNAVANQDGSGTNINAWASSSKVALTVNAQPGNTNASFRVNDTNGAAILQVNTNNQLTVSNIGIKAGATVAMVLTCTNADGSGTWSNLPALFQGASTALTNLAALTAGTNEVIQLPVASAKLPGTNMAYFEGGYQDWELEFPRTNNAGTDIALSATWQFSVPNNYATNTMTLRLLHSITATNGPNVSNVVWRASFLHSEPGSTTDLRTGSFGTAYLVTNTWAACFNCTNQLASSTISFTNQSGLSANGFGILKLERVSTSDGYVGAAALIGATLEYGKQ